MKHTDARGRVDVQLQVERDEVAITVTDTGIGVAPQDVERLPDPFFRTDLARDRMGMGLGLGLGIAQSIVVAPGGRIEVTSNPGEGSCFRVVRHLVASRSDDLVWLFPIVRNVVE